MHILIDVQGCQSGSRFRGIGRSALAISRAIIKNKGYHRVSILLNGMYSMERIDEARKAFIDLLSPEEMFIFSGVGPIAYIDKNNHVRNAIAGEVRNIAIANICPDIVLITGFFEGYWDEYITTVPEKSVTWKTVCICHDLIPLLDKSFYFTDKLFGDWYMAKLANYQNADAVLSISQSSRKEILEHTSYPAEKIFHISSGVSDQFQVRQYSDEQKTRLRKIYNLPKTFVMSTAIDEPRKNVTALIKAYSGLDAGLRQQYPLVLTYGINAHNMFKFKCIAANNGIASGQLIFTGYLPDDDLIALYNLCTVFVFPSLHEGFGLPPLEAMKCGAATLGSNTTSIPEVIGWEEATFDPRNIGEICAKIKQALTDEHFYQQLKKHALSQAAKFSWENTAKLALACIDSFDTHAEGETLAIPTRLSLERLTENVINEINHYPKISEYDRLNYAWAIAKNSFSQQRRKLLIDISELVQQDDRSGIQRVSRSILYELLNGYIAGYDVRAVYYVKGECYRYANQFVRQNYDIDFGENEPVLFSHDDIMLVTDLTISCFPQVLPNIDSARRSGSHVYYVVHDILPTKNPEWSSKEMQQLFPNWLKWIATYGTGIICVSKSVADDVRKWVNNHDDLNLNKYLSIDHFYLGANFGSSRPTRGIPSSGKILLKMLDECQSFLMVGTLEPRKRHAQVLAAFELLWAEGFDYRLVIAGKYGWNVEALVWKIKHHPELNRRLFWLQDVSDEYLEKLYSVANALIFPSKGEGFGLPLIEAAQKGLPLILRDIPVFREIAGENALYFYGENGESLRDAILAWMALNAQKIAPDSTHIHWLTWKQSAELLLSKLPLAQGTRIFL